MPKSYSKVVEAVQTVNIDLDALVSQYAQSDELHVPDVGNVKLQPAKERHHQAIDQLKDYTPKDATKVGKYVAIDCEMVGVGAEGLTSALARVSIVNFHGHVLLDEYCRPQERIVDYRTKFSGIHPHHMVHAKSFLEVQRLVDTVIKDKIVVGHSLNSDFSALQLSHPRNQRRDTANYRPFRKHFANGRTPGLKMLCREILQKEIQTGAVVADEGGHSGHSSVEDARAVMLLFRHVKSEWESKMKSMRRTHK